MKKSAVILHKARSCGLGMTVVTRNVSDFEPTGVATLNPWMAV